MATLTNLLREIIDDYVIKEIGDGSSSPFQYHKLNSYQYVFQVELNDQSVNVEVDFEDFDDQELSFKRSKLPSRFHFADKTFNAAFKVGDSQYQFEKSDAKTLLRILSTVSKIIKEFVQEIKPNIIFVFATGKSVNGDNSIKNRIYDSFLWKQIDSISGYSAEDRSGGFIIYNTSYRKR